MKVAILGAGKLGIRITEALLDGDYDITLVDTNEDKLNALSQQYDVMTVTGDAKTVELLRQINVSTAYEPDGFHLRSHEHRFACKPGYSHHI